MTEIETKKSRMIADTRDMLRAHPEGLTPRKIVNKLLHLKNTPDNIANKLIMEILGERDEFEFGGGFWRLAVRNPVGLNDVPFVVVDVETTGCRSDFNRVIEVAAFRVIGGDIVASMATLINPRCSIPPEITYLTGIRDAHVAGAPVAEEVMPGFLEFLGDSVFVAHSAKFDYSFLNAETLRCGLPPIHNELLCTVKLGRRSFPGENSYGLDRMIERFSIAIDPKDRHRAGGDAWATSKLLLLCLERLHGAGITTLDSLLSINAMPPKRVALKLGLQ
jgi:DNA polymerase III epsilon subunit family exonuclease